jgi:hypothetical protein
MSLTAAPPTEARRRRALPRISVELAGYLFIAVALSGLLWARISEVDGFFLDEWFYTHAAEYMWDNFPGAVLGTIPEWNRGPQRAYSALMAPAWGLVAPSTAFTLTHMMNVGLLVSAIVPSALLARRVIAAPALRVLAVALAVAVPWLAVGSHLLTENLAFPLFVWAVYFIVRTAEAPSLANQTLAIAGIGLLALVRLNLAPLFAVLVLAVVVAEFRHRRQHGDLRLGRWLRGALRREALVAAATLVASGVGLALLLRGSSSLGAYGGFTFDSLAQGLWGEKAELTRRTFMTYARGLVAGSFVMPFAMGLGVGLAGAFGRLGRPLHIPSLVTLGGLVVVLGGVSFWTAGSALEERYVFYAYAPLAVLACAGLEHLERLRWWTAAGSAITLWALITGFPAAAANSGHFFAAPAGAFWERVVVHRLRAYESDLLGWTMLGQTGWLVVALALALLVAVVGNARVRPRVVAWLLASGLALCAIAQVTTLDYVLKQELYGTREAPGGIAGLPGHDDDREDWVDARIPDGGRAGVLPGLLGVDGAYGGQERISFWNRDLSVTVSTPWNGAPTPAPPGYGVVVTSPAADGLARWDGELPRWIAAHVDDPRIQFRARLVERSPTSRFGLFRVEPAERALWTGIGIDADGALQQRRRAVFTFDRAAAPEASEMKLTFRGPAEVRAPVRWRVERGHRLVAAGTVAPGTQDSTRLDVPTCRAASCGPVSWALTATGPPAAIPLPGFGAPGPGRPVTLFVDGAHIE